MPTNTEAPPSWQFPPVSTADDNGLLAIGADLEPQTLLAAYSQGIFPMPVSDDYIGWWSPNPRGVLELDHLIVHRSLRRAMRRFDVSVNTAFAQVVDGCADPKRPQGWIDDRMSAAYVRLHEIGHAHSVEVWHQGELVGGLYGIAIGGLFAAESKFHKMSDASKVALVALVEGLRDGYDRLIDAQFPTTHLGTLGITAISGEAYLKRIAEVMNSPLPAFLTRPS